MIIETIFTAIMTRGMARNRPLLKHLILFMFVATIVFPYETLSEISSDANDGNLDATQPSASTSSVLSTFPEKLKTTEKSKKEKTLRFTTGLKNVTKEAGGFLRLRCAVTGSVPATKFEWYSNEAPLIEGNTFS